LLLVVAVELLIRHFVTLGAITPIRNVLQGR